MVVAAHALRFLARDLARASVQREQLDIRMN